MKKVRQILITIFIMLLPVSSAVYGFTWTTNKRLSATADNCCPVIAVDRSNIYVVWTNGKIYFKRSVDGGVSWEKDMLLTNNSFVFHQPAIAAKGSNIYVIWTSGEVYFKRSVDGGVTWKPDMRLTNNAGSAGNEAIAVDGSNIYVVWHDDTPEGDWDIFQAVS